MFSYTQIFGFTGVLSTAIIVVQNLKSSTDGKQHQSETELATKKTWNLKANGQQVETQEIMKPIPCDIVEIKDV